MYDVYCSVPEFVFLKLQKIIIFAFSQRTNPRGHCGRGFFMMDDSEPQYDFGPHSALIQIEIYTQNFDFSGFIDVTERVYYHLFNIDSRLGHRVTYSMFLHYHTTVLNAVILDVARKNGELKVPGAGYAQDILPLELYIPGPIHEYLQHIGNVTSVYDYEVRFNLPDIAVPGVGENRGHFGRIDAANHNVYECYVSPHVTSRRVLASMAEQENWTLPEIVGDLQPNENLLGYGPIDTFVGGRTYGFQFPNTDDLEGRLQYCPALMMRVNNAIREYKDRFKMFNIGVDDYGKRNRITSKPSLSNLLFVTTDVDKSVRLSLNSVRISSFGSFSGSTSGQANFNILHRLRSARAPGLCCLTADGRQPADWVHHINANFEMTGVFIPTIGVQEPNLRMEMFFSLCPKGVRSTFLDKFITRNYYLEKK